MLEDVFFVDPSVHHVHSDVEYDKIKCVHLQSVIIFLLGVEVQIEVLDYYIVLLIPLGDLVK